MDIMNFLTLFGLFDIPTAIVAVIMLFVGWNLPQPVWAQVVSAKVKELWGKLKAKIVGLFTRS
jgi:hypothetical protein